ncbi:MAG TPA: DUF3014 domain-containing protein [Usitatibacter sp.]|nr:DUF3014 domain-containing protein [Usitatibacter sp.]
MASRAVGIGIGVVIVAAIGAGAYYWWQQQSRPPSLPPPTAAQSPAPAPTGPKHPLPTEAAAPLPTLNESDAAMNEALASLLGNQAVQRFLNVDGIVRRIVATVDNLPRETLATRLNPVKPVGGAFVTRGPEGSLTIAPENAQRYTPLVRLMEQVDTKKAVALYVRFYPLFQQAYEELGYPGRYFNDRLVEAIDNMLDAPEPDKPVALVVPHVLYEYQDPEIESRSAGQKVLVRIGRSNEAVVKAKLRELRQEVVAGAAKR